jgi:hypothetical protein
MSCDNVFVGAPDGVEAQCGLEYLVDACLGDLFEQAYLDGGAKRASAAVSDRLARSISIVGPLADCLFVSLPAPTRAECEPLLAGIIPDGTDK